MLKKPNSLNISFSNKYNLVSNILGILESDDFCGYKPQVYTQLENLQTKFRDDAYFVLEYPYVDRHYRDTYYSYYSSKFKRIGRDCIRAHIFNREITKNDLIKKDANDDKEKKYWGFFIIRPLPLYILGRSLISPEAFVTNNFVCCLTKDRVSLMGNEFTVYGFPHVAQDTETHTCAESSLYSFIEYYGSEYREYKPLLPSQIIKKLMDNIEHRLLPSKGLTEIELAKCLQSNNFQCSIYSKIGKSVLFNRMLQIYVESGMPLLLKMENTKDGHAVLVIGHEDDSIPDIKNDPLLKHNAWIDVSFHSKKLVFIDDNMPPYQIVNISQPTAHYTDSRFNEMDATCFIVPLPMHVFLNAERAFALMKIILNTKGISLDETGEKWITRLLLTNSHSFKNFINKTENIIKSTKITYNTYKKVPYSIKEELLHLPMPRSIWLVELYKLNNYSKNDGYSSGLLIMDATSDGKSLEAVLWYAVDNRQFTHNNIVWDEKYRPIEKFQMGTYRSNLKGEWNEWKS